MALANVAVGCVLVSPVGLNGTPTHDSSRAGAQSLRSMSMSDLEASEAITSEEIVHGNLEEIVHDHLDAEPVPSDYYFNYGCYDNKAMYDSLVAVPVCEPDLTDNNAPGLMSNKQDLMNSIYLHRI